MIQNTSCATRRVVAPKNAPQSAPPARKPVTVLMTAMLALTLSACAVGPTYQRPEVGEIPAAFKEAGAWVSATPADASPRGNWWQIFNDPQLDALANRAQVSNQNIAAATAAYAQARALVRVQRASLFPSVSLNGGATRTGTGGGRSVVTSNSGGISTTSEGGRTSTNYQVSIGASWEPDVWGRLGRAVQGASASAQASAADLANATLSIQGELAVNYFSLRQTDVQRALLRDTIEAYQRVMQITQNRYNAGLVAKTDLLQAQTQLANAQADDLTLQRQRAQLEHAIAVLTGQTPSSFSLPPIAWTATVPAVPAVLPSTLLQRRPDIAAAERRAAQANEQIGIAKAAYFPNFGLSASTGSTASLLPDLFTTPAAVWSLGLSAAQVIFNAGATTARVDAARAAYDQAVANYRQTVLNAFANVEDNLSATRVLSEQLALRQAASAAADEAERQFLNRYREGRVSYTEVVSAQTTALNARRTLVQLQADRVTTAVALVQALGGSWVGF